MPSPKRVKLGNESKTKSSTVPIYRHKFKSQWLRKHASLLHIPEDYDKELVRPHGVMVSCKIKSETRALGQARTLIEEMMVRLFPSSQPVWGNPHEVSDIELPVESLPQPETVTNTKKDRKFQAVDSACAGTLFIRFRVNVTPKEFCMALFDFASQLDENERVRMASKISHCTRFVPIEYTFPSHMADIQQHLARLMPLQTDMLQNASTVCAMIQVRNNSTIDKAKLKEQVAEFFLNRQWKIDLKKPQWVVYICVFKSIAGVSFLRDYFGKYKRYNLSAFIQDKSVESND